MLTVGDNEEKNITVSLRTRENQVIGEMTLEKFIDDALKEINKFFKCHFSYHLVFSCSKRL